VEGEKAMTPQNKAYTLFGLAFAIVAAGVVARIVSPSPPLENDLCTRGSFPSLSVVVLVDPTDPFDQSDYRAVQNEIEERRGKLKKGDRLSIVAISPNGSQVVRVLFSKCHPGDGSGESDLFKNRKRMKKRYDEQFLKPLEEVVREIQNLQGAETSALLAALHYVVKMPSFASSERRVLIFVSDLLEHSQESDHYHSSYSFSGVQQSLYVKGVKEKMSGVEVIIFKRVRKETDQHQTKQHEEFWNQYWAAAGVVNPDVRELRGEQEAAARKLAVSSKLGSKPRR
jgi:hypothetical protein